MQKNYQAVKKAWHRCPETAISEKTQRGPVLNYGIDTNYDTTLSSSWQRCSAQEAKKPLKKRQIIGYIFRPWRTHPQTGEKLWARDYGRKAWKIPVYAN